MPDKDRAPSIGVLRNFAAVFEWIDQSQVGGPSVVPGYALRGHCWCSVKPFGDQLLLGAQIVESSGIRGTHLIRTRYREDLTIRSMLELRAHGTRNRYRVVSVRNDDARRYTECAVEELGDVTVVGTAPPIPRGLEAMEDYGHAD